MDYTMIECGSLPSSPYSLLSNEPERFLVMPTPTMELIPTPTIDEIWIASALTFGFFEG